MPTPMHCCLLLCLFWSLHSKVASATEPVDEVSQVCGRNALFLLLRAYGADYSLDEVASVTPIGPLGTSLKELKESAAALQLPCDVIRTDIRALQELVDHQRPCIVLVEGGGVIPDDNATLASGHYLVLLRFSNEDRRIHLLEGSYGLPTSYTEARFQQKWTGYALLPRQPHSTKAAIATALHFLFWAVLICFPQLMLSRIRPMNRSSIGGGDVTTEALRVKQ